MRGSVDMNFLFTLGEVQRLVRAYADKQAARYGITRAQWAVLAKVERTEGLKQTELAEQMEMQPITLTRLIDKLCDNGWIERRGDETDRRVNRLYLRKAARPLLGKLSGLRSELTATALEGINPADAHRMLTQLESIKENVRNAIQNPAGEPPRKEAPLWLIPFSNSRPNKRAIRLACGAAETCRGTAPPADGGHAALSPLSAAGRAAFGRALAGVTFYLNGGRYVTTDDAYVGAQKVLITPDISGKIEKVVVKEGQQVNEGDVLFEIDPVPFRLAVAQAKATLAQAKVTYDNLIADLKIYGQMGELAQQGVDLKRRDVDRKPALVKNNFGSQLDLDNRRPRWSPPAPRWSCCGRRSRPPKRNCSATPTCRSRNFRPMPRPKPRSTRPSAISTTP